MITQALASVPASLSAVAQLAAGYDQLNSSIGRFGTDTLIADTHALASGSASNDGRFQAEQAILTSLANDRDRAATTIKQELSGAAQGTRPRLAR